MIRNELNLGLGTTAEEICKSLKENKEILERPIGFESEKRDCTVRALSKASGLPYEKVHKAFKEEGRKEGHGILMEGILQSICNSLGLEAKQVKRTGTVRKFIKAFPKGNFYCLTYGHAFAIVNGKSYDLKSQGYYLKGAWLITRRA